MRDDDALHMSRALELAHRGLYSTDPNPRVGCVLVRDGVVVGEGWHARAGEAHAEVHAIEAAGERARGATAYVSLEPCCHHGRTGPCSERLISAGVARVVAAMTDPDPRTDGNGLAALEGAGVEVTRGVLEDAARALNAGFVSRHVRGRPWVRVKMAASLDARTAMADGESRWITGTEARRDVQHLRARSSAVLTGIGTLLADDPSLTVREVQPEDGGPVRQPLRVVLARRLRTPADARLLGEPGATLIATEVDDPAAHRALIEAGAEILPLAGDTLAALMQALAERAVNEVLVEAGATLAGALVEAALVDEIVLYTAPILLGDAARGLFRLPGVRRLGDAVELQIIDVRTIGKDLRITAKPVQARGSTAEDGKA
ncbi:MAG: bifunctional diaminohydroxyphosphoribosylaminopyrimidine deaminase/5-amino-6-(5-phosphoribosylamino)uracil reductase RibD [Gammaproteobacteria bacterium]|nr:bifunctional diaminohydroxyphosphoribosylaminopyrimidine deaminase/5-amino-6-(5-phosphoribosylamino)uracil reductase RibD [Gammaproteobacteria bacterium]